MSNEQKLVVPAYFGIDSESCSFGVDSCWKVIEDAGSLVRWVVANGLPSLKQDNPDGLPAVRAQLDSCRAKGQLVFGYVDSGFGWVNQEGIGANIALWYEVFPENLNGIMFDNGPSFDPDQVPPDSVLAGMDADTFLQKRYKEIIDLVRTGHSGHDLVLVNASGFPNPWLLELANFVNVWEGRMDLYLNNFVAGEPGGVNGNPPTWWNDEDGRTSNIIVGCTDQMSMNMVIALSKSRTGTVYVIDSPTASYGHLPSYWPEEKAAARGTGADTQRRYPKSRKGSGTVDR